MALHVRDIAWRGLTAGMQAIRNADTFGVLQITLGAGTYQWRFVHVVGATFTDTGTGTCH